MKQCPNPNCILYTRLEELPDAYTKCPGCGGQLVDSSMSSGALHSGYLTRLPGGLGQRDLDQEFQNAFPEEAFPQEALPQAGSPFAFVEAGPVAHPRPEEEYNPYVATEQDESVDMPPLGLSRGARVGYVLALLLLLFSCVLFFVVIGSRFLQSGAVAPAAATETAIVALRPAVNTPVNVMPTAQQSQLPPAQPSPTVALPTAVPTQPPTVAAVQPPTAAPPEQPTAITVQQLPPTKAPLPPSPTAQPAPTQAHSVPPTAPPAQPAPSGGVSNAQMVIGLQAGQPAGNVSAYHATDPFVLAVQARFGPGGVTTMKTRWYGPDGSLLYEIPRDFPNQGTYYTAFTLKKSTPWLTGDYRVDIHTNNSPAPAYTVTFSVVP